VSGIMISQVDAFTAEAFGGNPAGVCILPEDEPEAWMRAVAAEMNLSETAFLRADVDHRYRIRWLTPTTEVPLCGHATLASAHVLWEEGRVPKTEPISLRSRSGELAAHREGEWIRLDFPRLPLEPATVPAGFAEALGASPLRVFRNAFPTFLVELESEEVVRRLAPRFRRLVEIGAGRCIVTAGSDSPEFDFVSRFFAPEVGIDEDPVTGSAHCSLAPYWAERLGKPHLTARQVSRRGGVLRLRLEGERVHILGQAVTVLRGALATAARPREAGQ